MPQELKTSGKALTKGKVKPKDDVTVYGTGASRFMLAGVKYIVHTALADKLIEQGKATTEYVEPSIIDTTDYDDVEAASAAAAASLAGKGAKGGKPDEK